MINLLSKPSIYMGTKLMVIGWAIETSLRIIISFLKIVYTFYVFKLKSRSALLSPKYMGEWAVVTGSTDGIGLEYAKQLAEIGFNIVLVSRSQEKLDNVRSQIVSECPEVQVCTIQADFSLMSPKEYDRIENELIRKIGPVDDNLDIGILVNNAGVCYDRLIPFEQVNRLMIDQMVKVNISAVMHITRIVLPYMLQSKKKCLIANVSSICGVIHSPFVTVYTATKASIISFSKALKSELKSTNVDVQCIYPGLVATKMAYAIPYIEDKKDLLRAQTPKDFVRSALNSVGSFECTSGCFAHFIFFELVHYLTPRCLMLRDIRRGLAKQEKGG